MTAATEVDTCPRWCTQERGHTGQMHARTVALIGKGSFGIDIVQLENDGGLTFESPKIHIGDEVLNVTEARAVAWSLLVAADHLEEMDKKYAFHW